MSVEGGFVSVEGVFISVEGVFISVEGGFVSVRKGTVSCGAPGVNSPRWYRSPICAAQDVLPGRM